MRQRTVLFPIAAAFVLTAVATAAHAGAWLPARGEYYSELIAGRSIGDTYYDADGIRLVRPNGTFEEIRELRVRSEFGWKKWASLSIGAPIRSRTQNLGEEFGYPAVTVTGLADLDLGMRFKLRDGMSALALQFDWRAPLGYEHDPADTTAVPPAQREIAATHLGTGRQNVGLTLLFGQGLPAWNSFVEAEAGYRSELLKNGGSETFGAATAGVWLGPAVLISGRYDVMFANDNFGGPFGAIGSLFAERVQHTVRPQILYRVDDRLDVFLGSVHTASGENVLHRDVFYVGMAFKSTQRNRYQGFLGSKRNS